MGIGAGISLIVLGILAAASVIIKKKPEAKDLIDKIVPFQGWIGFICCLWGLTWIVLSLLWIGWSLALGLWGIIYLILSLGTGVILAVLGFILGYGLINKFALSKANDQARQKAEEVLKKLVNIQIPLGYISIILGLATIIWNFIPYF